MQSYVQKHAFLIYINNDKKVVSLILLVSHGLSVRILLFTEVTYAKNSSILLQTGANGHNEEK